MRFLARSPVYSHVSTTISGLVSIRSYGAQQMFINQFCCYQNDHSATWFIYVSGVRILAYLIDSICALYILSIYIGLIVFSNGIFTVLFDYLPLIKYNNLICSINLW